MRMFAALVILVAISASSGCGDAREDTLARRLPNAPTFPVIPYTSEPPPAPGVLAISKLVVTFNGAVLIADFTLNETSGQGSVILESITFEESGGLSDLLDAGCWGDDPIKILPLGSFNQAPGDYCQPRINTKTPGEFASLTVVYRQNDGTREPVQANVRIPRR